MLNTNKVDFAILLAGGKSSRMNEDKALLAINDTTLLGFQKDRLSSIADNVLISRNDDNPAHIKDTKPAYGPLAGIHACLAHIKETSGKLGADAFVMPVDMPLATKVLLDHLIQYGQIHHKACHYDTHFLPIYLPDVQAALSILETMLAEELRLVNTFIEKLDAEDIDCPDHGKLANANTPMQWKIISRQIKENK